MNIIRRFAVAAVSGVTLIPLAVFAQAKCTVNGVEAPCPEGLKVAGWAVAGFGIFAIGMLVVSIAAFVFWLMMIIHAASKPIENKPLWIVLIVLTGIIGAIVYYFVVKRKFSATPPAPTGPVAPGMPQ